MTDETFLARWARLKRERVQSVPTAAPVPEEGNSEEGNDEERHDDREHLPPLPTLDDVAALTADSDFRRFMAPGVSPDVHRAALKKMWQSDPIITTHDGLTDYADDFSIVPAVAKAVRTVLRVGETVADVLDGNERVETIEVNESNRYAVMGAAAGSKTPEG